MRFFALALMCLIASHSTLRAEEANCDGYSIWHVIPEELLVKERLIEKVQKLREVIASVRTYDVAKRNITVSVTDCPVHGHRIRASAQFSIASFVTAPGFPSFSEEYDVYITLGELRSISDDDLVEVGRAQSCLIHAGMADDWYRSHDRTSRAVNECRRDTARAMGDSEEASWFTRLIENPSVLYSETNVGIRKQRKKFK